MNRLTREDTKFNGYTHEEVITSDLDSGECLTKLAAYEDTGLEPEKIQQLNDAFINSQKKLEKTFDELFKYKNLEEQGLLIKLPCKVGDIVWCIDDTDEDLPWCIEFDYFMIDQIGKTVFLTREEAEKALEVENDKND